MITTPPAQWDQVVDVVVLGSGCAGLVAATLAHDGGASVLVLEKADLIGGTTGVSGGMPWIPMNRHMADVGQTDSRAEALAYVRRLTLGREPDPELVEVYVDQATEALDYLETNTPLRMAAPTTFNDYYAHLPGGKWAGRSIEPAPFDAPAELGEWAARLRTSPHLPRLTMEEGAKFLRGDAPPDLSLIAQREQADERVLGAAMVAMLFKGLLDRGVPVVTEAAAQQLVVVDGDVVGVEVEVASPVASRQLIGARRGVVLACGGFEWDDAMVKAYIGQELEPLSPPHNTGDGHRMAMEAGAELANMTSYWGQPAILEPGATFEGRPMVQMGSVRSVPGVIVVNKHGRRFVNESATYQDFPKVQTVFDPVALDYPNEAPQWAVFDQRVKDSAVVLPSVLPGQPAPDWIPRATTVAKLASRIGVDPATLEATVARWNSQVAAGSDPDFGRATTAFEAQMTGHPPSPEVCLAPVEQPPFYAVQLRNGTLGTNGGARIDADGRVRRHDGGVVPGLYAAGNAAASVFGPAYPGGGATLGPALTFGYLAGRHAANAPNRVGLGSASAPAPAVPAPSADAGTSALLRSSGPGIGHLASGDPAALPGHVAVANQLGLYAERIDAGDFAGVGAMFAYATVSSEGIEQTYTGADEVRGMYESWTRRYDDGTPHTKHVTTNLVVEVDEDAGIGTCRSYVTVFQATEALALQPIFAGRYHDRFERVVGAWRFTHRHIITDYVGDLSHHLTQALDP